MHGWLDNLGVFEPLVSHLSKDYEIFAFDLPGHGESDHVQWPWAYSHSDLPMYFHEIRQNVGWENFHVVAHRY
jgi:pimeloyl-ACP methyl ester carboxylesterase